MKVRILAGTALLVACVSACETQGEFVDEEQFGSIREEVISAEQLVEAIGPPSVAIPRADGTQIWHYRGIYRQADPSYYVPYLGLLIGTNSKKCTTLTVLVNADGSLSEWDYSTAKGSEFWASTSDKCDKDANAAEAEEPAP
jgi:outer membrane protein assembly factor BamE (lipoprotein component of BamABCDE complex)